MTVTISSDADVTAKYFQTLAVSAPARMKSLTKSSAKILKAQIQSMAPTDTGRYRASMRIEWASADKNTYSFEVGSDLHYGYSLEFGGHGVDSRGRMVNRRPQPHFRPALREFVPHFEAAIREALR